MKNILRTYQTTLAWIVASIWGLDALVYAVRFEHPLNIILCGTGSILCILNAICSYIISKKGLQ